MTIENKWDLTTEAERGYIAGIIDGEGCITIDKSSSHWTGRNIYSVRVVVSMTDKQVPLFLHQKFGGAFYEYQRKNTNCKVTHIWKLTNSKTTNFLRLIQPYLLIKRPQVEVALRFISTLYPQGRLHGKFVSELDGVLNHRDRLKLEINHLNQRGKVGAI